MHVVLRSQDSPEVAINHILEKLVVKEDKSNWKRPLHAFPSNIIE